MSPPLRFRHKRALGLGARIYDLDGLEHLACAILPKLKWTSVRFVSIHPAEFLSPAFADDDLVCSRASNVAPSGRPESLITPKDTWANLN